MDITKIEGIKSPILSFFIGLVFAAPPTWYVSKQIHDERIETYKIQINSANEKLAQFESNNRQWAEHYASLKKQAEALANELTEERKRPSADELISRLDQEISNKKMQIAMYSQIRTITQNGEQKTEKSDSTLTLEKELEMLIMQRDKARQQQISSAAN